MSAANLGPNYAPFLLQHLKSLIGINAPETKITPTGFTKMLLENTPKLQVKPSEVLRLNESDGHIKQIRLSYLKRITPDLIQTDDDCENDLIPVYNDMVLEAPHFAKYSFWISDDTIARYMADASRTVAQGQPATPLMQEHLTTLMTVVNGIVGKIDQTLLEDVTWGVNQVTGVNAATTININKNATVNDLETGFAKLLSDAAENEIAGDLLMAGSGLFNNFMLQKPFSGMNQAGVNQSAATGYKWYFDVYAKSASTFGTNQVGVFAPGTIGFVDLQKYIAFRSGQKGTSFFFQIPLPVATGQGDGTAEMMIFDAQLKYIDCPTTLYNGYSNVTVNRGWQLIISKNYGLFQQPTDGYTSGDRLTGNNGALRYTFTNTCDDCDA
jgi:hypothetical protein